MQLGLRIAACPEDLADGKEWSFYLLNDGKAALDLVVLETFGHEWGSEGPTVHPGAKFTDVGAGASVRIWRDNDDEVRMWLTLLVHSGGRETKLMAEFPLLYKRKSTLPVLLELAKPGFVVPAIAVSRPAA